MSEIVFDENDFIVDGNEHDFGDEIGKYRIIRYNTGYYGLQKYIDEVDEWNTLFISPEIDRPLDVGYDWTFSPGRLIMKTCISCLEDARKLHDNELMELHLHLNYDSDEYKELLTDIESCDADKITGRINELLDLQEKKIEEYYDKQLNIRNTMVYPLLLVVVGLIIVNILLIIL